MNALTHTTEIAGLASQGALFVLNHSAGKDSQAMTIEVAEFLKREGVDLKTQVLVIHADLGRIEWSGNVDHIKATTADTLGFEPDFLVAEALDKQGNVKDLLDIVRRRKMFPSPAMRWCTSDLKRGPIEREVRRHIKRHKLSGLVVSCMGIRAEESTSRAKLTPFKFDKNNSKAGREWYVWLPIFNHTTQEVFQTIEQAGQEPHWAYQAGMSRLSCSFCIMANNADLKTAARLRPELYAEYVALEQEVGHTFSMSRKPLTEVTGLPVLDNHKG